MERKEEGKRNGENMLEEEEGKEKEKEISRKRVEKKEKDKIETGAVKNKIFSQR